MKYSPMLLIFLFLVPFVAAENLLFEFDHEHKPITPVVESILFAYTDQSPLNLGAAQNHTDVVVNVNESFYRFNGSSYINWTYNDVFDYEGNNNLTVSFWFRVPSGPQAENYVLASHYFGDVGYRFRTISTTGNLFVRVGNGTATIMNSGIAHNNSNWYNAITVFNEQTDIMSLYIDNVLVDSDSIPVGNLSHGNILRLGASIEFTTQKFRGYMDDFRIYDSALNASDRALLLNNDTDFTDDLVFWLPVNTSAATTEAHPIIDSVYLYNYPHWISLGQVTPLTVTNFDAGTDNYAEISISNGSFFNMTYANKTNMFSTAVLSNVEEDVTFNVTFYDALHNPIVTAEHTLKFRIPFNVTFDFFKNVNYTQVDLEPYNNEFQYALLRWKDANETYSYELKAPNYINFMNNVGGLFPYYTDIESEEGLPISDEIYLFGDIDDGSATIQVYENASYDIFVYDTRWKNPLSDFYEFGRPIPNAKYEMMSKIAGGVPISVEQDQTFSVFISAWEVYRWNMVKNFLKIMLAFFVWAICIVGLSYLAVSFVPNQEIQAKAFAAIVGTLVLVTSPLLIVAVRMII